MHLYCGCVDKCFCTEEFEFNSATSNTEIDIVEEFENKITRSTQTVNSQFSDNALDRLNSLLQVYSNDRKTTKLLKDIKYFILN